MAASKGYGKAISGMGKGGKIDPEMLRRLLAMMQARGGQPMPQGQGMPMPQGQSMPMPPIGR